MIIQAKVRGFICTTAHPVGCAQHIQEQIDYVKKHGTMSHGPKKVLVVGSSMGYGLASRIVAAFGSQAATIGVFFEREAEGKKTATAGWYNSVAFEQKAKQAGLYAKSFNGDAFSAEIKEKVAHAIKDDLGSIDCLVYSLASPRRQHPQTGQVSKSVLKPIGAEYTNKSIDLSNYKLEMVTLPQATQEEIDQTVAVMGGEDWEMWINLLQNKGLLQKGFKTVAYSYIGPEVTHPIYRQGTIGKAKEHLEKTAQKLNQQLAKVNGRATISVNKALVTQSSSAIPIVPLYFALLKKVMKEKGLEEDSIAQMSRLFTTRLFTQGTIPVDQNGLIRMDDYEMREDVQGEVLDNWNKVNEHNLQDLTDLEGYQQDFLKLFGFGFKNVNYDLDVESDLKLPSCPSASL